MKRFNTNTEDFDYDPDAEMAAFEEMELHFGQSFDNEDDD